MQKKYRIIGVNYLMHENEPSDGDDEIVIGKIEIDKNGNIEKLYSTEHDPEDVVHQTIFDPEEFDELRFQEVETIQRLHKIREAGLKIQEHGYIK